jgi:hypothetical protein
MAIRLIVPFSAGRRLYAVIEFDADEMKVKSPGTIPWRLQMLAGRRGRVLLSPALAKLSQRKR